MFNGFLKNKYGDIESKLITKNTNKTSIILGSPHHDSSGVINNNAQ